MEQAWKEASKILSVEGSSSWRSPASILIDPLDWSLPSAALPPLSQMEDKFHPIHEDDDIRRLFEAPQDERDLDKWLAGEFNPCSDKDAMLVETIPDHKTNLIDFIPKNGCRRGPRTARKRVAFPLKRLCFENMTFATRGKIRGARRNNDHWTLKEVSILVKGVSKHGVGRWTILKNDCFSTSVRTAVNLKDKWRNLLKACGIKFRSKKKVKAQKTMLQPLNPTLIENIKSLAKHGKLKVLAQRLATDAGVIYAPLA